MNLVLKTALEAPCKTGKDFSAVLICECDTVSQSCQVLLLLQNHLQEEDGRLLYELWNTNDLDVQEYRNAASHSAVQADIIIIGMGEESGLVESARWVNQWLPDRQNQPGALVAVLHPRLENSNQFLIVLDQLQKETASAKMDFFVTKAKEALENKGNRGGSEAARQVAWMRQIGAARGLSAADTKETRKTTQTMSAKSEPKTMINHDTIAQLAQKIWRAEGCPPGRDLEWWLRAEQQLQASSSTSTQPPANAVLSRKASTATAKSLTGKVTATPPRQRATLTRN